MSQHRACLRSKLWGGAEARNGGERTILIGGGFDSMSGSGSRVADTCNPLLGAEYENSQNTYNNTGL